MAALPEGVVVVTGTNGKTTTTKMVATILGERYRVLTNDTGSNFVRGAITATVEHASWSGRLPYDVAVFELDEAWAVRFVDGRAAAARAAAQRHARPARPLRRDRHDGRPARQGRRGHHRARRAQPRRRAGRRAGRGRPAPRCPTTASRPALRELFPNDEELYGGPVLVSAAARRPSSCAPCPAPADRRRAVRIDGTDHDVVLRAEGPHNAQNAVRRRGPRADVRASTRRPLPAGLRQGLAGVRPRPDLRRRRPRGSSCSW